MTLRERLAALVLEPGSVEAVTTEEAPALVVLLSAITAGLAARMAAAPSSVGGEQDGDRLLTPAEAAARLGLSRAELYRRAHRFPFARRLGRRTLRFSQAGLERYLSKHNR